MKAIAALDSLCEALAKERPLALLLTCSLIAACVFCLSLFDIHFLLGTSDFWNNPRGILPKSWADIPGALSGYLYFQRDTWHWPLFHVDKLGAPGGLNIIFADSIPWLALAGRFAFLATGHPVNLYGLWIAVCFAASAMTLTALVASLGQRNMAAAAMATVAGLCMPALLARWGHMSLMAQFEIPLALIFYLRQRDCSRPWRSFLPAAGLIWLTLWTHTYLFAMVFAIVVATFAQAASSRAITWTSFAGLLAGLIAATSCLIALSGHLQSGGGFAAEGVGIFSMNLLSPFVPQRSGLFSALRNVTADATGGQYEGFSYLGGGILMLLLVTHPWQISRFREGVRRNPWISALFLCFTLFALSNVVYLGTLRLIDVSLPPPLQQLAGMFRSTGRFFWPVMYSLTALAIVAPISFCGRYGVLLLGLAMPLQWIDSAPLRLALAASTRAPQKPHIDLAAWQAAIRQHNSVRVLPQNFCLAHGIGWNSEVAVQLQLLAARADRPINSVYAARLGPDCRAEQKIDGTPQAGARQLSVFLDEFSGFSRMRQKAMTDSSCRAGRGLVVCSDIPAEGPALDLLAQTDRQ